MSKTILYITNGISGSGGLERVVSLKASYFADHYNYNVHIITLNECDKTPFYSLSNKVSVHNITTCTNILKFYKDYYIGIRNYIYKINPDVIFVADDGLKGVLFPLIFKPKCKVIYERHTTKAIHGNGLKAKIISKLMDYGSTKFDSFVVLTYSNKNDWQKAKNLTVIPNPTPFKCRNIPDINSRNKIISVGSLSYVKGHDTLINAWSKICKEFPSYTLHIYGAKKDNYPNLINLIDLHKLSDSVFIHEPVTNIKEKYLESSLCILPSRVEGFGMVLIEAMECGTPCIATKCEGPIDIINNESDGYLIDVDDINNLADKMFLYLSDQNIKTKLSTNSRNKADIFRIDSIISKWHNLII